MDLIQSHKQSLFISIMFACKVQSALEWNGGWVIIVIPYLPTYLH